jgi:peptidoglycan hydrolase-like protein with peptidoglycan-binding domain
MWDKKGENISYNWLYKLKEDLLNEQEEEQFTGDRKSTEALSALSDEQLVKYATARADKCNSMGYVSLGNKNKEKVTIIQKKLKSDGANIADPEGTFGLTTLVATIASQKQAGIRTDGCVGPETLSALGLSLSDFGMKVDTPQEPMQGAVDGQAEVEIAEYTGKITPSKRQRSLDRITSIVLHDTLTSSLRGMIGAFSKPRTYTTKSGEEKTYYTGTHFSITADGKVRQHAPLAFPTNHTGTGGWNRKSVGIDIVTRAGGTGAGYKGYVPPTPDRDWET